MLRVSVGLFASFFLGIIFVSSPTYAAPTPDSCFAFDSGSGTLTDYYNNEGGNPGNPACSRNVEIPASIDGAAVTGIGPATFHSKAITAVTIPNSVISLGSHAFYNNQLTSVTIPNSITTIGYGAFAVNQLASVTIPNSVTAMDTNAFGNNNLSSVIISNQVTAIANSVFANNRLTSVIIPDSVTSIENSAFSRNRLTSVTIPNSVTHIKANAFYGNQLASITIPDSVTSIVDAAFAFNRLTEVTLPSSLQILDVTVFAGQNQRGGTIDDGSDPFHDISSNDPAIVQSTYDSIQYLRLYTSNGNLRDDAMSEWWWTGDYNQNGDMHDSLGGHLVNPASVTIRYQDQQGHQLQAPVQYTGVRSTDDSYLTNYFVTASGVKAPLNPRSPTPEELSDMTAGFAQYYRSGQTKTFTAPAIAGYVTPSAKTVTFDPGENTITFTYGKDAVPTISVNGDKAITKTPTIPSRPTFSGVATPGATVVVTVHSDPITCTTTADSNGNWSCTLPEGLPAGQHTVYVQVTNPDSSVENLGPYTVMVRDGSPTVLAPDSGVYKSTLVQLWAIPVVLGAALLTGSWYLMRRGSRRN